MKIVIVGVGALGSHLVLFSRNIKAEFEVIDFDRIEQKNIMSQFHTMMTNGQNKAQALQKSMLALFKTQIKANPHKLTSDNLNVLDKADLIVDCVDNIAARLLIQEYAKKNKIPCLHGALSADGQFGGVIWDEKFKPDAESSSGAPTCENGEHLPFIVQVSAAMALSIQEYVKNKTRTSKFIYPSSIKVI